MPPAYLSLCHIVCEGFHDYLELLFRWIFGLHEKTSMIWKTAFRMLFMYLFLLMILISWCSSSVMARVIQALQVYLHLPSHYITNRFLLSIHWWFSNLSDCFALAYDLLFPESALFLGDIIASSLNMFYIWPRDHNILPNIILTLLLRFCRIILPCLASRTRSLVMKKQITSS